MSNSRSRTLSVLCDLAASSVHPLRRSAVKVVRLRKYSAHARRFCHPVDRQNVSSGAHVGIVLLCCFVHRLERRVHRLFQGLVDLFLRPEERILVLHPFVITHRNAAGVRQNIGNEEDTLISQHAIRSRRRWSIRQLGNDFGFHLSDIFERDRIFQRRRQQYVTVNRQHVVAANLFGAAESGQASRFASCT